MNGARGNTNTRVSAQSRRTNSTRSRVASRVPGFEVAGLRGAADRRREDADVDADRSR